MSFDPVSFAKEKVAPRQPSASEMQERMNTLQQRLLDLRITGTSQDAAGHTVTVILNGKYTALEVTIDPAIAHDLPQLNQLIANAITSATQQAEQAIQQEFVKVMQGLNFPQ